MEGEEGEEWGGIVEQHAFLARPSVRCKREPQRTISGNKCDWRACPGMRTSVYTPTFRDSRFCGERSSLLSKRILSTILRVSNDPGSLELIEETIVDKKKKKKNKIRSRGIR